jgi:hypothetical protein
MIKHCYFLKLKFFVTVFAVSFCCNSLLAQDKSGAIWVWSDYCGIDFRDTSNVVPYYGMEFHNYSSSSCLSSPDGQVILTSNNSQFRDRYNQFVLNWDSLYPSFSPTKGFFFRSPNDTSLIHYLWGRGAQNPIWFKIKDVAPISYVMDTSIIEVSNFVSNSYPYYANHGVQSRAYDAVRHGNGRDWWIVAKMLQGYAGGNDSFVVFSLYDDSIFISNYQEIGPRFRAVWELDISNLGDKLCIMEGDTFKIYEYDFDRCSGTISNPVEVFNDHSFKTSANAPMGLAYSRSSNFIYACINDNYFHGCSDTIYQINPRTTIDSLKCTIIWYDTANVIGDSAGIYSLELGNDGNIYLGYTKGYGSGTGNQPILSYIGVIKNADMPYPYCSVEPMGVYLGAQCQANANNLLPSVPNYNLGPMIGSPCDTLNITSTGQWLSPASQVRVFPNPASDKLNISWPVQGGYSWVLKSLAGSTLSSGTQQAGNATISTANLPVGMYFLEVHSAKESKVEKVIISEK